MFVSSRFLCRFRSLSSVNDASGRGALLTLLLTVFFFNLWVLLREFAPNQIPRCLFLQAPPSCSISSCRRSTGCTFGGEQAQWWRTKSKATFDSWRTGGLCSALCGRGGNMALARLHISFIQRRPRTALCGVFLPWPLGCWKLSAESSIRSVRQFAAGLQRPQTTWSEAGCRLTQSSKSLRCFINIWAVGGLKPDRICADPLRCDLIGWFSGRKLRSELLKVFSGRSLVVLLWPFFFCSSDWALVFGQKTQLEPWESLQELMTHPVRIKLWLWKLQNSSSCSWIPESLQFFMLLQWLH